MRTMRIIGAKCAHRGIGAPRNWDRRHILVFDSKRRAGIPTSQTRAVVRLTPFGQAIDNGDVHRARRVRKGPEIVFGFAAGI
jgi:hypothetical protein